MRLILTLIFLSFASVAAAAPVLNFSDLISGPKTGLNDGVGSGVVVTVWGNNLGSTQGASKVYVGNVEATAVYYWKNADGTVPSGPADLYSYHKMQEVAFSVPATAVDGANTIKVVVNGATSNTLPFTVRTGNIYHVKTTGAPGNSGSWAAPWRYLTNVLSHVVAGDTVYVGDGVQDINTAGSEPTAAGLRVSGLVATTASQIAFVSYPGARVLAQGTNYGVDTYLTKGIVLSKYVVKVGDYPMPAPGDPILGKANGMGVKTSAWGRVVGNEVTQIEGRCVSGWGGAIASAGGAYDYVSDSRIYGNYIHGWGCDQTSKFEHTTYMTIRNGGAFDVTAWEMGWNYLTDNKARYGLHNYDENGTGPCGNFTTTLKVHDNVVRNQRGAGINVGAMAANGSVCWTGNVDTYNNLLINTGLGPNDESPIEAAAFRIGDTGQSGTLRYYNNTVDGYGDATAGSAANSAFAFYQTANSGRVYVNISNNILNSNNGYGYFSINETTYPYVTGSNNLLYGASGASIPANITGSVSTAPLLASDYTPTSSSPAINAGTTGLAATDLWQSPRPQGGAWDIGAFEYSGTVTLPVTPTTTRVFNGRLSGSWH